MSVVLARVVCTYIGPTAIRASKGAGSWCVKKEQPRDGYALAIVGLDEGKTS